ncbi:MAG: PHP-associated domain-containing protein [Candidatus Sulfobium sp.]|jgi:predicted metal-dependent phosphoesterase TrpH
MKYRVDLHVHSRFSGDNDSDPEDSIIRAIGLGLTGLAFTEHYSYDASAPVEALRQKYGNAIAIFRGVEFSSEEGHCLVFGVDTDRLSVARHAHVEELVKAVNEWGGVVIPSHPYRKGSGAGDMIRGIGGICAVEGYNGCNMNCFNEQAVALAAALNLPFTGGSDAHFPGEVGSCFTEFEDRPTYDNFVFLLQAGRYRGVDARKISRIHHFGQATVRD